MDTKRSASPKALISVLDENLTPVVGKTEQFSGYGVMGLCFSSGQVLAMRRFPASSVGPGYTSVWHRNAAGEWKFYQTVSPELACTRYFGAGVSEALVRKITVDWTGDYSFTVSIKDDVELTWDLSLASTSATRFMNNIGRQLPEAAWSNKLFLSMMGRMASIILKAGHIGLTGVAPNGQGFVANPRLIWMISSSKAILNGEDLGTPAPLKEQARLGDFWIPQRGILAVGGAAFDVYDPQRHQMITCTTPVKKTDEELIL